ncbi:MAG: TolB family protein [Promethearchaeota archaeon]
MDIEEFDVGVPRDVALKRYPGLEVDPEQRVEILPFRSNAFYFTHDFWLDDQTLLFQSTAERVDAPHARFAKRVALFRASFEPAGRDDSSAEVTLVLPPGEPCRTAVLSHAKDFLLVDSGTEFVVHDAGTWEVVRRIPAPIPEHYQRGQLSLTSDDEYLMYEVNLNWEFHGAEGQVDTSTFIQVVRLSTGEAVSFSHRPYPWFWNHVLCNPKNPRQVSAALIQYTEDYPNTKESGQRLWMFDLDGLAGFTNLAEASSGTPRVEKDPKCTHIYRQRPPGRWRRGEVVTHESWCSDGRHLTFIVRRKQIKRVDVRTGQSRVVMDGGPNPWHCDGRHPKWLVFDTMNKDSGIWVARADSTYLHHLCRQHTTAPGQEHHPHPFFSPDLSCVFFNVDVGGVEHLARVRVQPRLL